MGALRFAKASTRVLVLANSRIKGGGLREVALRSANASTQVLALANLRIEGMEGSEAQIGKFK